MLLNKKSVETVAIFAGENDARYILNGIHIETDGTMAATDGYIMGILGPDTTVDEKDFPVVKGQPEVKREKLKPVTLDLDGIRRAVKDLPKRTTLPVLQYARLDNAQTNAEKEDGFAPFAVTDLENSQIHNVRKVNGKFPNYEQVLPQGEPVFRVCLGADLLERLARAANKLGDGPTGNIIELEFFDHPKGLSAVQARVKDADTKQVLRVVVMPVKGQRSSEEYGLLKKKKEEPVKPKAAKKGVAA